MTTRADTRLFGDTFRTINAGWGRRRAFCWGDHLFTSTPFTWRPSVDARALPADRRGD